MTLQKKSLTPEQARQKIYRYCTYQERCHQEVRNKLFEMGLRSYEVDELIVHLIGEGFLNEERFAKAFAGGKFRMKNWGRIKIVSALEGKGLNGYCIKVGLAEIEDQEYLRTLEKILLKKLQDVLAEDSFTKRNMIARYAIQKGFESELVWVKVKEIIQK